MARVWSRSHVRALSRAASLWSAVGEWLSNMCSCGAPLPPPSVWFNNAMTGFILANTVTLALEHYGMSAGMQRVLDAVNLGAWGRRAGTWGSYVLHINIAACIDAGNRTAGAS